MNLATMELGIAKATAPLVKKARPKVEPGTTSLDIWARLQADMIVGEDETFTQTTSLCGKTFAALLLHRLGATRGGYEKLFLEVAESMVEAQGDKKAGDILKARVADLDTHIASFDRLMAQVGKGKRAGKVLMRDVVVTITENRE